MSQENINLSSRLEHRLEQELIDSNMDLSQNNTVKLPNSFCISLSKRPGMILASIGLILSAFDIVCVLDGFTHTNYNDDQKVIYLCTISAFALIFIHSSFSEYKCSCKNDNKDHKHNYILGKNINNIEIQINDDRDEGNNIQWQDVRNVLKKYVSPNSNSRYYQAPPELQLISSNPEAGASNELNIESLLDTICPQENSCDIKIYLYYMWEQYVQQKKSEYFSIRNEKIDLLNIKLPIWHSHYAYLNMFAIDFNLSVWALYTFNKPKLIYPVIFLSNYILIMLIGLKFIPWIRNKSIAAQKAVVINENSQEIISIFRKYRSCNDMVKINFIDTINDQAIDKK